MYCQTKKHFLWPTTALIIAVTALVAVRLVAPRPPIPTANNEIIHQVPNTISSTTPVKELVAAQRTCKRVNDLMTKTGGTIDPPLTTADCVVANKDCETRWGLHAVWAGVSDNNIPACDCDQGYVWASNGSGTCVYGTNDSIRVINVKPNTEIPATSIQVGTFHDGKDGYSLSIPSGNSSTCIWNYTGGTGAIPGSETTHARSATEKHTIYTNPFLYDWEVTCVDDFGNRYVGVFPSSS